MKVKYAISSYGKYGLHSHIVVCKNQPLCSDDNHEGHFNSFARAKRQLLEWAQDHVHSWRRACGEIRRMKKGDVEVG